MISADRFLRYADAPYAERADVNETSLDRRLSAAYAQGFQPLARLARSPGRFADRVDGHGAAYAGLDDAELAARVPRLSRELRRSGLSDEPLAETFALIRELSHRILGKRHYRVQVLGALALIRGQIAEMATGEGKTLTATLAVGAAALAGIPVHVVTVNDYLAERDGTEMAPLYRALGCSVGIIQNGQQPAEKRAAYGADITYCTNKELGFDYLRDRLALKDWPSASRLALVRALHGDDRSSGLLLRGLHFAIVDEADSILVDEARTPLIISAQGQGGLEAPALNQMLDIARRLRPGVDFDLAPTERAARLRRGAAARIEEQARSATALAGLAPVWVELVTQALAALHLYERDKHYIVKDGKVQIVDEYTGRVMPDRSWEHGLHQLIEAKEHCEVTAQRETLARITYQRFFRRYLHLAGMTGTGREMAGEFWAVYRLKVANIPTHRPCRRRAYPPRLYRSQERKWQAVVAAVRAEVETEGRPVLIGTRSVEASERLSEALAAAAIPHQVLNARQDADEARLVAQAGQAGVVTVATNMAGRGTDIKLEQAIAERGGLHVILTEFHDSARIDRQLYGRSGRQGDPGSYQAIVAVDDELFRLYAPAWLRRLALSEPAPAWLVRLWRVASQSKAERHHARIREQTLNLDRQIDRMLAFAGRE
jgi:preprotein translocase subunit SecA